MLKDYQRSSAPSQRIIGWEALATLTTGLLYPFGWIKSKDQKVCQRDQRTIVFIHGYGGSSSSFIPMGQFLKLFGYRNQLMFRYQATHGIDRIARDLKHFLKRNVRGGRIDLVCHSLGGLIARVYLQDLGGSRRVDRCITLGTPHRGTYSSYWLRTRVARELNPDSPFMARLARTETNAARVEFLSIVGGVDQIVVPRILAQPNEKSAVIFLAETGHLGLLYSPRAFQAILQHLGGRQEVKRSSLQSANLAEAFKF